MKLRRIITAALALSIVGSAAAVPAPVATGRPAAKAPAVQLWRPALPIRHVERPEIVRYGQPWIKLKEPGRDTHHLFNKWMEAVFEKHLYLMRKMFQGNHTDRWCKGLWRLECWTRQNVQEWCWILGNGYCLEDDIQWANERGMTAGEWWRKYAGYESGMVIALGWPVISDHASTVHYYASTSDGDAGNDGLSEGSPKDTIANALALASNGTAYVIHLKRGDTFTGQVTVNGKDGVDADNPAVFTTYGVGARPIITSATDAWYVYTTNLAASNGYLLFNNLDMVPTVAGNGTGFFCFNRKTEVTVSGCRFRDWLVGLNFTHVDADQRPSNITVRRCVIQDNTTLGIITGDTDGVMVRECVFDFNGWSGGDTGHGQRHNTYIHYSCTDASMVECVSGRASFAGCSVRCYGLQFGNVAIKNPMNIGMGHAQATDAGGYCGFNISHRSRDVNSSEPIGWSIRCEQCTAGLELCYNIVKENTSSTGNAYALEVIDSADVEVHHNVMYQWHIVAYDYGGPVRFSGTNTGTNTYHHNIIEQGVGACFNGTYAPWTFSNNTWFSTNSAPNFIDNGVSYATFTTNTGETSPSQTQPTFTDDSRTIDTYLTSIGETGDEDDYMTLCRDQAEGNWNDDLTAMAFGDYLREGMDLPLMGITDLAVAVNAADITLTASATNNPFVTGYGVYRQKDGGGYSKVATTATLPYDDLGLANGTYDYRLLIEYDTLTFGGVGEQFPYSNVDSGTVVDGIGPTPPEIRVLNIGPLSIGVVQ